VAISAILSPLAMAQSELWDKRDWGARYKSVWIYVANFDPYLTLHEDGIVIQFALKIVS
jgi:hypothetical protein